MKTIFNKGDIYLLSFIKFKMAEKIDKKYIEEKIKIKDKFVSKQLNYLSFNSKYEKELERISKENITKINQLKKKSEINIKKEITKINKNHRILKGASNKMILDIIFNNQKMKNIFFNTVTNNNNLKKIKKKTVSFSPKYNYKECHTDNIQLSPNIKKNKFKHSLSFYSTNMDNIKLNNIFPNINNNFSIKNNINNGNINVENNNHLYSSQKLLKNFTTKKDEVKGMLTVNYNLNKIKKNNKFRKSLSNIQLNSIKYTN